MKIKQIAAIAMTLTLTASTTLTQAQTATFGQVKPTSNVVFEYDASITTQNGVRTDISGAGGGQVDVIGQIFQPVNGDDIDATGFAVRHREEGITFSAGQNVRMAITKDSDGNSTFTLADQVLGVWDFDVAGLAPGGTNNRYLVLDLAGSTTPVVTLEDNVQHMIQMTLTLDAADTERFRWRRDNNNSQTIPFSATTGGQMYQRLAWDFDGGVPRTYDPNVDFPLLPNDPARVQATQTSAQSIMVIGTVVPVELSTFSID